MLAKGPGNTELHWEGGACGQWLTGRTPSAVLLMGLLFAASAVSAGLLSIAAPNRIVMLIMIALVFLTWTLIDRVGLWWGGSETRARWTPRIVPLTMLGHQSFLIATNAVFGVDRSCHAALLRSPVLRLCFFCLFAIAGCLHVATTASRSCEWRLCSMIPLVCMMLSNLYLCMTVHHVAPELIQHAALNGPLAYVVGLAVGGIIEQLVRSLFADLSATNKMRMEELQAEVAGRLADCRRKKQEMVARIDELDAANDAKLSLIQQQNSVLSAASCEIVKQVCHLSAQPSLPSTSSNVLHTPHHSLPCMQVGVAAQAGRGLREEVRAPGERVLRVGVRAAFAVAPPPAVNAAER